jgi:hypothetical protein
VTLAKMKITIVVLVFFTCLSGSTAVYSQDDDTIQYIHGLPETGEDTLQAPPRDDFQPTDSFVEIAVEQLPQALVKTLNDDAVYAGWENSIVQLDKNTGNYWIQIQKGDVIRYFCFNQQGKIVSMDERNVAED